MKRKSLILLAILSTIIFLMSVHPSHAGTVYRDRYRVLNQSAPCFYRFADGYNINLNMVKVAAIGSFQDDVWDTREREWKKTPFYYSFRVTMFDGSTYQEKGNDGRVKGQRASVPCGCTQVLTSTGQLEGGALL